MIPGLRQTLLSALLSLATIPLARADSATLRYENITDREVREIQGVLAGLLPGVIVNIGSVIEGCDCEEGPHCTDQVWVVAHQPGENSSLHLSKMDGRWGLGPLETWRKDFALLLDQRDDIIGPLRGPDYASRRNNYIERRNALWAAQPQCKARIADRAVPAP